MIIVQNYVILFGTRPHTQECGGGSAWMAGLLHGLVDSNSNNDNSNNNSNTNTNTNTNNDITNSNNRIIVAIVIRTIDK